MLDILIRLVTSLMEAWTLIVVIIISIAIIACFIDPMIRDYLRKKYPKYATYDAKKRPKELTKEERTQKCLEIFEKFGIGPDEKIIKTTGKWAKNDARDWHTIREYAERHNHEDSLLIMSCFTSKYELLNWADREWNNKIEHSEWRETFYKCAFEHGNEYQRRKAKKEIRNQRAIKFADSPALSIIGAIGVAFIIGLAILARFGA